MKQIDIIYTFIGAAGAILILIGFFQMSNGRWRHKTFWYVFCNFFGAVLAAAYQIHFRAYISVVVNIIWAVVAFHGLQPFVKKYNRKVERKVERVGKKYNRKVGRYSKKIQKDIKRDVRRGYKNSRRRLATKHK